LEVSDADEVVAVEVAVVEGNCAWAEAAKDWTELIEADAAITCD
jgi:hypothetical protein